MEDQLTSEAVEAEAARLEHLSRRILVTQDQDLHFVPWVESGCNIVCPS